MIITLTIVGLLIIVFVIGKVNLSRRFNKEVEELFSQSTDISAQKFSYRQLDNLPEPVKRYFKHVLKEGQSYISFASLTHNGQFKAGLDKKWIDIKGEQYFTTQKPGFIWKGTTAMFIARDMFIADEGRLIVSLFSLYNIVDGKGENYNQGELLRWLGESVWFPTNLLPGDKLTWLPVDSKTAKLIFSYNGLSLCFIVTFNEQGEITQMETKRYMNEKKLEPWICKVGDYKELNGILVPTSAEAIWKVDNMEYSYARFNVKKLVYNIPKAF